MGQHLSTTYYKLYFTTYMVLLYEHAFWQLLQVFEILDFSLFGYTMSSIFFPTQLTSASSDAVLEIVSPVSFPFLEPVSSLSVIVSSPSVVSSSA